MYILLVYERDILACSVIPFQNLDIVLLYSAGLLSNALITASNAAVKEQIPLVIRECVVIEFFKFPAKIIYEVIFCMYL